MILQYDQIQEIARLHKYFGRDKQRGELESICTECLPKGVYRCRVLKGLVVTEYIVKARAYLKRLEVMQEIAA
jgi:hypothetical protein